MIGRCYCGAVQFLAKNPQGCDYCHCSICRRLHGAPFVTWAAFTQDDIKITSGKHVLKKYSSSKHAVRTSCGVCGTWLFFESVDWPGMVDVVLAALPKDVDMRPQAHVYWADRDTRVFIADDLPKYPEDYK